MTQRRAFLTQLGLLATAVGFPADEVQAASTSTDSPWDTSWLDQLASAQFRVVFNASEINDGAALDYAASFLDDFHDVHRTRDAQTRPIVVFRRLGTPMAFNDAMWDRYAMGEELKIRDPATRAPARRNVFWQAREGAAPREAATTLATLHQRGLISLVCNVALGNWAARMAARTQRDKDEVRAEVRANLVPGAILAPSGIYALIRAQNAGCAYMPGT